MSYLEIKKLQHSYPKSEEPTFSNISLTLDKNSTLAIIGPSGEGKSTLLRCIAGFENIQDGSIQLGENYLCKSTNSSLSTNLPPEQRNIGIVPQNSCLFPHLTISENIAFGLFKLNKSERETRVNELIEVMQLTKCRNSYAHETSGGQQQRAALARALAPKPKLLLLDEPFANLDNELKTHLHDFLNTALKQEGITTIMVTHSQRDVEKLAKHIVELKDKKMNILK